MTSAIRFVREHGWLGLAKELRRRRHTARWERRLNVSTAGLIENTALKSVRSDAKHYHPIGYEHLFWALQQIPFPEKDVVFIDIGAGKGRVVAAAASRPFKKVIGVELDEELVESARKNLAGMKGRRAQEVSVLAADATEFVFPEDTNVLFLYNPFDGETLDRVIANIGAFHERSQRELFIIYFNHAHFDQRVRGEKWLEKSYESEFFPKTGGALYRTRHPVK